MKEFLLLTPGPTQVPRRVLDAVGLPMIHHRTRDYQAVLERVNANLQKVFLTRHPVMTFACSSTGAMEGSITNLLSKGDTVLSFSAGKWGERYRDIARAWGLDVRSVEKRYGESVTAGEVREGLKKHPGARAVLVALCETSTAALHPVEAIAAVTRQSGALLMVDAVSGLGCDVFKMDEWGVDVAVCGSQKGLMLPPGLGFVAVNERAIEACSKSDLPKYYFNFMDTLKMQKKNDTPFTPAVGLVRGLDAALQMILEEGLENVWRRHAGIAGFVRGKVRSLGLELFAKTPSQALTAITMPEDTVSGEVIRRMRDDHQVIMADGQGELKGRIVRFAHMGAACTQETAERGSAALIDAMSVSSGHRPQGRG